MTVKTPFFISPAYSVPRITSSPVLEAEVDAGLRGHADREPIGRKLAGVVDHVIGLAEVFQLLLAWAESASCA